MNVCFLVFRVDKDSIFFSPAKHLPLKSVHALQAGAQTIDDVVTAQTLPTHTFVTKRGWNFAHDTFDSRIGAQTANSLGQQSDILLGSEETILLGMAHIVPFHGRTTKYLQLVKFYGSQPKRVYLSNGLQHHIVPFARQTYDKVASTRNSTLVAQLHSANRVLPRMTAIHTTQSRIKGRLHTKFHGNIIPLAQFGHKVEDRFIHTIGSRADNQSSHILTSQSLLVSVAKNLNGRVRIGIGLKINQPSCPRHPATGMELAASSHLFAYTPTTVGIARREGIIITKRAASHAHPSIAVGA